jgi:hypothetical protein
MLTCLTYVSFIINLWVAQPAVTTPVQLEFKPFENPLTYQSEGSIVIRLNNIQQQQIPVSYTLTVQHQTRDQVELPTPDNSNGDSSESSTTSIFYDQVQYSVNYAKPQPMELNFSFPRLSSGEILTQYTEFYPSYQNIPLFPIYAISPNTHWEAAGIRVLDLREFGFDEPYQYTFPIKFHFYKQDGNLAYIRYQYIEDHNFGFLFGRDAMQMGYGQDVTGQFPVRIMSINNGEIIFNIEQGWVEQESIQSTVIEILKDGTIKDIKSEEQIQLELGV